MTGEAMLEFVTQKAQLDANTFRGLFEVVCDGVLGKTSCLAQVGMHYYVITINIALKYQLNVETTPIVISVR